MNHVGITGTREGMTPLQKKSLFDFFALGTMMKLHHGCCVGVDEEAHWLAYGFDIPCVGHRPIVTTYEMPVCDGEGGFEELRKPKGYLARNRDIVDETEYLIVVPKEFDEQKRGGTWYTYRYARSVHKDVVLIWPDGKVKLQKGSNI